MTKEEESFSEREAFTSIHGETLRYRKRFDALVAEGIPGGGLLVDAKLTLGCGRFGATTEEVFADLNALLAAPDMYPLTCFHRP